jgi:hypothetical protein
MNILREVLDLFEDDQVQKCASNIEELGLDK